MLKTQVIKSNGFTLIELLAVISLLAILFLLVVPKVTDIISQNKIKATKISISNLIDVADNDYMENGNQANLVYTYSTSDGLKDGTRSISVGNKIKDANGIIAYTYSNGDSKSASCFYIDGNTYKYENSDFMTLNIGINSCD